MWEVDQDKLACEADYWWHPGQAPVDDDAAMLMLIPAQALPIVYGDIQRLSDVCHTWQDISSWACTLAREHRFGLLMLLMFLGEVLLSIIAVAQ